VTNAAFFLKNICFSWALILWQKFLEKLDISQQKFMEKKCFT